MDLQPNRNVGLENQLQAIQLGASLYDRAQTQKRMMEQLQVQTAESLIQRQGMELQNKIREDSLAEAIGERKAQVDEYNTFSTLGKQVSDYLSNTKPGAVFPVVPPFKSKTYRAEADKMMNNLEKYSPRAELLKTQEKARNGAIANQTAILKEAMQIPGAVDINPQTEEPTINWTVFNAGRKQVFDASVQKTQAQTGSIVGNLQLSRDKLNALIANNASDAEIAMARLAVDKSFKEARVKLDEEEFGFNKQFKTTELGINQQRVDIAKNNLLRLEQEGKDKKAIEEARMIYRDALDSKKLELENKKFDATKGVQLEKLEQGKTRLQQNQQRIDAYKQKLLQPVKAGEIKLNSVDDRMVKKFADDISILEDPTIDDYVKRASAQNILKVLNSAEGKDAVGVEEAKRLGQFLEFQINPIRAISTGRAFGTDMPRFIEQISIKKGELDTRVDQSMVRINDIYKKYGKEIPAGTSQTPSRGSLMTAPAPQTMRSTNAPAMSQTNSPSMSPTNALAMSGTNSMSEISFESTAEARAKGKKTGDFVIIKGVKGNLK
jgi:hypothetical protein